MITKNIVNGVADSLTKSEELFLKHTETSRVNNGSTITYYHGDEPVKAIDLEDIKYGITDLIDQKSIEVISSGFVFNSKTFSLSDAAQRNITNVKIAPESKFPIVFVTKDDKDFIELKFSDRDDFYDAAFDTVRAIRESNGLKKLQISNCTTIEELDALKIQFGL